jgi:ABC-type transporter Mla subunit MlaD
MFFFLKFLRQVVDTINSTFNHNHNQLQHQIGGLCSQLQDVQQHEHEKCETLKHNLREITEAFSLAQMEYSNNNQDKVSYNFFVV